MAIEVMDGDGHIEGSGWDLAMCQREERLAKLTADVEKRERKADEHEKLLRSLEANLKRQLADVHRQRDEFETYKSSYGNPDEVRALKQMLRMQAMEQNNRLIIGQSGTGGAVHVNIPGTDGSYTISTALP